MTPNPTVTTAAILPGHNSAESQRIGAASFMATLHRLAGDVEAQSGSVPVREVSPPPVLCPQPDSPVRFMPLGRGGTSTVAGSPGPIWVGDGCWTYLDFASFEGADFAYAVCRSLLHRGPSKKQIHVAQSGSAGERLLLLLEADRKARRIGGLGRLVNLPGTRLLYGAFRTARKLKVIPLSAILRRLIDARARRLFAQNRDLLVQRRLALTTLDLLSRRG